MPRPISEKEVKKDAPYKSLNTESRKNALLDAEGNQISDIPITRHFVIEPITQE